MRQYTTPEQTAKLIELGFENPKSIRRATPCGVGAVWNERAYSIGELIGMLPRVIEYRGFYYGLQITTDCAYSWEISYEPCPYEKRKPKILPLFDGGSCLIDKIFGILLQLVEMKDEFTDIVGHKERGSEEVISKVFKLKEEGVI